MDTYVHLVALTSWTQQKYNRLIHEYSFQFVPNIKKIHQGASEILYSQKWERMGQMEVYWKHDVSMAPETITFNYTAGPCAPRRCRSTPLHAKKQIFLASSGLLQVTEVALQQAAIKPSSITAANLRFSLTLSLCRPFLYGCLQIMPRSACSDRLAAFQLAAMRAILKWDAFKVRTPVEPGLIWTSGGVKQDRGKHSAHRWPQLRFVGSKLPFGDKFSTAITPNVQLKKD